MPEEEKEKFREMANKETERYNAEMKIDAAETKNCDNAPKKYL